MIISHYCLRNDILKLYEEDDSFGNFGLITKIFFFSASV